MGRVITWCVMFAFLFLAGSFTPAAAKNDESEIKLDDLNEAPLDPLHLLEKSYDNPAYRTIITGYAVASYKYNNNGVINGHGNELHFAQDKADTQRFGFNLMEVGFTKRYSDHAWVAAAVEVGLHDGGSKTETELDVGEIHLIAPVGNGIDFTFGKFSSPVSFEQEDAPLLLQASHSLAYQFASPAKMAASCEKSLPVSSRGFSPRAPRRRRDIPGGCVPASDSGSTMCNSRAAELRRRPR